MSQLSKVGTMANSALQQTFRMPGSGRDSLAEETKLSNRTCKDSCRVIEGQPAVSLTCDDGMCGRESDGP